MSEKEIKTGSIHEKNDLTQGPILKKLLVFAFPMILSNFVFQFYNAADSAIMGNYVSSDALAAVSSSMVPMNMFNALFFGLSIGTGVVVSQYFGARQMDKINSAVNSSILLGTIIGLFIIIAGTLTARPMLRLLDTPENIFQDSYEYLFAIYFGMLSNTLYNIGAGILRALGDSKYPLYFLCISATANVLLCLLCVCVFHMGVLGTAIPTVITQTLSCVLVLWRLNSGKYPVKIDWKHPTLDWSMLKYIIKLGVPSALQNMIMSIGGMFLQRFANGFGSNIIAANSVVQKTDGFVVMPMMGIGGAMTTFVGQNIGASRTDRVKEGVRTSVIILVGFASVLGVLLWFWGGDFMRVFTPNEAVLSISRVGIRILAFFYMFMGLAQIFTGTLRGAGSAFSPMIITMVSTLTRIPVAYFIAVRPDNPYGLFWSMAISVVLNFVLSFGYYKFGGWQKHSIVAQEKRDQQRMAEAKAAEEQAAE